MISNREFSRVSSLQLPIVSTSDCKGRNDCFARSVPLSQFPSDACLASSKSSVGAKREKVKTLWAVTQNADHANCADRTDWVLFILVFAFTFDSHVFWFWSKISVPLYSCFDKGPTKVLKGARQCRLVLWVISVSHCLIEYQGQSGTRRRKHEYTCLCCLLPPRWNTLRLNQVTVKLCRMPRHIECVSEGLATRYAAVINSSWRCSWLRGTRRK